jgi:hypothetical protein
MLSTLLLYPTCPECGGNLPFVSRRFALNEGANESNFFSRRNRYVQIHSIVCPGCNAFFSVQQRGLGLVLVGVAAVCGVAYLGGNGRAEMGVGVQWLFGGSVMALVIAWLISHRMTVLTLCSRAGEAPKDDPQVADVFTQLQARDAQLEQQQEGDRQTLETAEAAWVTEEARPVTCPRCGAGNAPDFEKCWSCDAALTAQR